MSCRDLLMLTLLSLPLAACGMEGLGAPGGLPRALESVPLAEESPPPDFEAPLVCNCIPANTDDERLPGEPDPDQMGNRDLAPTPPTFQELAEQARRFEEAMSAASH